MKIYVQCVLFGLLIMAVSGFPSQSRRQVFNPNLLMDRYMNMRTNQGNFGSYHPNDIVEDIDKFMENGGGHANSDNHWGLVVYNPNAAMPQYMGQLQEPGNLAPGLQNAGVAGGDSNQNGGDSHHGGFNPDELNRQLMQAAHRSAYSGFSTVLKQSQDGSGGTVSDTQHAGFNADQVNAGLLGAISYNPNSVNSATFNMPSFGASGQHMTGQNGNAGAQNGNSETNNKPAASGGSPASLAGAGSQNGQTATGNTAGQAAADGNGLFSQTNSANIHQAGASMAGTAQATGIGGAGSYNPFSAGGTGASSGGQHGGGKVIPSTRVSQNGLPPGVPAGLKLSQTEAEDPVVNGIGELGN